MTNRFDLYVFEFRHAVPRKKKTERKEKKKKKEKEKEYLCPLPRWKFLRNDVHVTSKRFKGNIRTILLISSKLGNEAIDRGGTPV